jgi:hypothetical protein
MCHMMDAPLPSPILPSLMCKAVIMGLGRLD